MVVHLVILPNWNSLDSVRHAHSDLEAAGLVFFALLVLMETLAHNSEDAHRRHRFDSIGIWFFALAIFCEIGAYWYGQRNDALSQQVIISLDAEARDAFTNASSALTKAGGADTKSEDAEQKVRAVHNEADAIQGRFKKTSAELAALGKDVAAQGPRWKILKARRNELLKELKPLAPQTVTVVLCGTTLSASPEQFGLIMQVSELLSGNPGAGWSSKPAQWNSCPPNGLFTFGGNMVLVSAVAGNPVKKAATALSGVLTKIGISTSKNEVAQTEVSFMGKLFGSGSPWDLAVDDPTSMVLFIGASPMGGFTTSTQSNNH